MNCRGCGVELEPSEEQVNNAVDQILETSLKDAVHSGGVCPLCGHSKATPYSQRRSILFGMLGACLVALGAAVLIFHHFRTTERASVITAAVARLSNNPTVKEEIGTPLSAAGEINGNVNQDETGWKEAHLSFPVQGPRGKAKVQLIAGRESGAWTFTTFEIDFEQQHKKLDLVSGRIVEYAPGAYVDVHTEAAKQPQAAERVVLESHFDGTFPCVYAAVSEGSVSPNLGRCAMPVVHHGSVDRFEADLRDGTFVMRETDLEINDVFDVPLTRSYRSRQWAVNNPVQAFGRNSNHPYDIAPVGTRNPYTWQLLVLEDGDFLYFNRISKGSGYADAVYMHTETSTPFYKATQQWNGNGWTMKLADGSEILFPESYNARNMAQGAPFEIRDGNGDRLELVRDGKGNLQEIKTPHGHWIQFAYDDLSRITRAVTDAGKWAQYQYNSDGLLSDAKFSSGRQRHYKYQNALMTQIIDESGRVLVRNTYDRGLLMGQQFGDGRDYSYHYDWDPTRTYPDSVRVTLPDQTTKDLSVQDSVSEFVRNYHK